MGLAGVSGKGVCVCVCVCVSFCANQLYFFRGKLTALLFQII